VEFLTREHPEWQRDASGFVAEATSGVDACEEVISVENQAWMTRWEQDPPS
jgi:hypothetical protein